MPRHLIVYIAMSVDGYIAKPNDDLSFLSIVEKEGEDYGYADFIASVDTVIIGRKMYDWVTKQFDFPDADKTDYVITKTPRPSIVKTVFYNSDLNELVIQLKGEKDQTIFCDGGAAIVNELLR